MRKTKKRLRKEMSVTLKIRKDEQREIECLYDAKVTLANTCTELKHTRQKLEEVRKDNQTLLPLCDKAENILRVLLEKWISKETRKKVALIIRFYHRNERLEMYYAMLQYVMTGRKTRFDKAVMQWHFRLFAEMVDEDRYTVPSNTLLKRLWRKVGLVEGIGN